MKSVDSKLLFYPLHSLVCAVGLFYSSVKFGTMAYWGNGLTWYWVGATLTYLIGLLGIIFIILSLKERGGNYGLFRYSINLLRTLSILALGLGFLWTTFLIIAGMSGM